MLRRADREHAFFRTRLLLVPPGATKGRVEAVLVERLLQRLRLHDVRIQCRPVLEGIDTHRQALDVDVDTEVEAEALGGLFSERDHVPKLPGRVDVKKRERGNRRKEGLHRQVQHHRAVLPDGIEHDRSLAFGDDLAHDVDAFPFEALKIGELFHSEVAWRSTGCRKLDAVHRRTERDIIAPPVSMATRSLPLTWHPSADRWNAGFITAHDELRGPPRSKGRAALFSGNRSTW
jgi:hypothetical protein